MGFDGATPHAHCRETDGFAPGWLRLAGLGRRGRHLGNGRRHRENYSQRRDLEFWTQVFQPIRNFHFQMELQG